MIVLRGVSRAEEALNSNCAKRPRIVRRDRDQSSPAAASPSGELCNEKAVKINRVKHYCVVCRIATQAHRPRNALNSESRAEKPQIVVASSAAIEIQAPSAGESYVAHYLQGKYRAKK